MTAAPQSSLVELVAKAIAASIYRSEGLEIMNYDGVGDYCRREWRFYVAEAEAALTACHADDLIKALKVAHAHAKELRDAWQRGAISEHDGQGGTRSNRNVDVEVRLRDLLSHLDDRA